MIFFSPPSVMSADLTWLIVKNNHAFLHKRDRAQFSCESGNVMNLNSYKFSGLANKKTVDVSQDAAGKISITTKKPSAFYAQKVAGSTKNWSLNRHMVNKKCVGAVKTLTAKSYYVPRQSPQICHCPLPCPPEVHQG